MGLGVGGREILGLWWIFVHLPVGFRDCPCVLDGKMGCDQETQQCCPSTLSLTRKAGGIRWGWWGLIMYAAILWALCFEQSWACQCFFPLVDFIGKNFESVRQTQFAMQACSGIHFRYNVPFLIVLQDDLAIISPLSLNELLMLLIYHQPRD